MSYTLCFEYVLEYDARGRYRPHRAKIHIEGLDRQEPMIRAIAQSGTFYEHDLLLHLALRGPRGGTFIDVGANFGNHSIFFGKFLADHVICIEPQTRMQNLLRCNLVANDIADFSLFDSAVGSAPGTGYMQLPDGAQRDAGMARLVGADSRVSGKGEKLVDVTTLDLLLAEHRRSRSDRHRVSLVKIDVEGMQMDVLAGAKELLAEERPQLVIEAPTADEQDELNTFLGKFGYTAVGRFCSTPTFHYIAPEYHRLRSLPLRYRTSRTIRKLPYWRGALRKRLRRLKL